MLVANGNFRKALLVTQAIFAQPDLDPIDMPAEDSEPTWEPIHEDVVAVIKLLPFGVTADYFYTGAISAFRVWGGDCDIARQYLNIAVHFNPRILASILTEAGTPRESFCTSR